MIEQGTDGRLRTHFCNGRLCPICQAIRTAKVIDKYLPSIRSFDDPHFLTLTRRSVAAPLLSSTIGAMRREYGLILDTLRKRSKVNGLRKLEVPFNARTEEFQPHFHVIADGEETAERILEQWLKRNRSTAVARAQELRRIESEEGEELRIVFGYVTKLVTRFDNGTERVPIGALDTVVASLMGERTLLPSGSLWGRSNDSEVIRGEELTSYLSPVVSRFGEQIYWQWVQDTKTWVDAGTGELLV